MKIFLNLFLVLLIILFGGNYFLYVILYGSSHNIPEKSASFVDNNFIVLGTLIFILIVAKIIFHYKSKKFDSEF